MDETVAELDAKTKRANTAMLWTALASGVYFLLMIAVFSQLRTPLPDWMPLFFLPVPGFVIAIRVLQARRTSLKSQALVAQFRLTSASVYKLADEIEEHQRRRASGDA